MPPSKLTPVNSKPITDALVRIMTEPSFAVSHLQAGQSQTLQYMIGWLCALPHTHALSRHQDSTVQQHTNCKHCLQGQVWHMINLKKSALITCMSCKPYQSYYRNGGVCTCCASNYFVMGSHACTPCSTEEPLLTGIKWVLHASAGECTEGAEETD